MGNTASTKEAPSPTSSPASDHQTYGNTMSKMKLMIGDGSEKNLTFVKDLVASMTSGTNNSELIAEFVNNYNKSLKPENAAMKIELDSLEQPLKVLKEHHNNMGNAKVNSRIEGLRGKQNAERANALRSLPSDSLSVYNAFLKVAGNKIDPIRTNLQAMPFLQNNPDVKNVVEKIFDGMGSLNARSMFYEYKYISMYIFMTVLVQHMYNTMDKFILEVVELNELRNNYRQQANKDIFDTIFAAVDKSGVDITQHLPKHDDMIKAKTEELQKKIDTVKGNYGKAIETNMQGLIKFILDNDEHLKQSMLQTLSESTKAQAAVPVGVVGGFVKDGSTFPQSFYSLSSKCS
jgi:hypothetical protein